MAFEELVIDLGNKVMMKLVLIPAGEFIMGGVAENEDRPAHEVKITKPFYIGIYPVTQAQYQAVMGYNPSSFSGKEQASQATWYDGLKDNQPQFLKSVCESNKNQSSFFGKVKVLMGINPPPIKGGNLPVECVSWNNATEFCERLSAKKGKTFRLPTEAEWEYACTAGEMLLYYMASDMSWDEYVWHKTNSEGKTHPVGQKLPNGWGLYDMVGNVWEWCQDESEVGQTYSHEVNDIDIDPQGPQSTMSIKRVLRGASWDDFFHGNIQSSSGLLDSAADNWGFRVCCNK